MQQKSFHHRWPPRWPGAWAWQHRRHSRSRPLPGSLASADPAGQARGSRGRPEDRPRRRSQCAAWSESELALEHRQHVVPALVPPGLAWLSPVPLPGIKNGLDAMRGEGLKRNHIGVVQLFENQFLRDGRTCHRQGRGLLDLNHHGRAFGESQGRRRTARGKTR